MSIKIDFNDEEFRELIRDEAIDAVSEQEFGVDCPHCDKTFNAHPGINKCPHCQNMVELTIDINF